MLYRTKKSDDADFETFTKNRNYEENGDKIILLSDFPACSSFEGYYQ